MLARTYEKDHPFWIYPKDDPAWLESIVKEFKIHPVTAQVLVSRGFTTHQEIHDFLYSKLPDLYDPFMLAEMPQAVERVLKALENKENILIYGDNDVDGMTGTALLTDFLRFIGANVFFYLSSRGIVRENLFVEALEYAHENQCTLMITVDCGITAHQEIAKVVAKGVDVIVTDHHEPTDKIPHCVATLNPKLLNNSYPNRDLTGVGVAFKLAHAITNQLVDDGKIPSNKVDLKRYLDLVALGTVADMGPLRGENRILVRYGLRQLKKGKRIGLCKLVSVSDLELNQISSFTIATKIAPRLNSLGRIADPKKGVELLLIRNAQAAEKMAQELDLNNIERQKIERTMSQDVDKMIEGHPDLLKNRAIVLFSNKWHPGVIAILSTRICKQFNRPCIMIAIEDGIGKGSLRSIHEMPLLPALKECSDLLINFGGHDFAAGLTIKPDNIAKFTERFLKIANQQLSDKDVMSKIALDAKVNFDEITFDFMESMKLFEPFGNENPPPLLYAQCKQAWPPKVVGKTHLKMYLEQNDRMLEGIAYNRGSQNGDLRKKNLLLEIAFTPQINTFQGVSIQLLVRDFKIIS
jgi:single-stranded-DNA-specific exonuclease